MNKSVIGLALFVATSAHAASAANLSDLEPCMNGGVSAAGLFVDQGREDLVTQLAPIMSADEFALEPCINGDVSALGTMPVELSADSRLAALQAGDAE